MKIKHLLIRNLKYKIEQTNSITPGKIMPYLQLSSLVQYPNATKPEAIIGIKKLAAPPPAFPNPPATALAVPLMTGANMTEV